MSEDSIIPQQISVSKAILMAQRDGLDRFLDKYGMYKSDKIGSSVSDVNTIFDNLFEELNNFPSRYDKFCYDLDGLISNGFLLVYKKSYSYTMKPPKFNIVEKVINVLWKQSCIKRTMTDYEIEHGYPELFEKLLINCQQLELFDFHNHTFENVFNNLSELVHRNTGCDSRTFSLQINENVFVKYSSYLKDKTIFDAIEQICMFFHNINNVCGVSSGIHILLQNVFNNMIKLPRFKHYIPEKCKDDDEFMVDILAEHEKTYANAESRIDSATGFPVFFDRLVSEKV